jgi:hypothetical protein
MGFVARYRSKDALADFLGRPARALPAPAAVA